ncbi:plastocyanin/azurin family copper-binding protein [Nocardia sp. NPDC051052]|uniref:cupredoxin domain-containing protein n=1 Tax=Nocardia sp. NPDC051052 TaxID=3364322 RepID=UPI0037A7196D
MQRLTHSMAVLIVALVGAGGISCARTPAPVTISIDAALSNGGVFDPATVTVPAGTVVTWVQHDPDHLQTVTADDDSFGSYFLHTGQSYTVRFNSPGSYRYHCDIHNGMRGAVIVT